MSIEDMVGQLGDRLDSLVAKIDQVAKSVRASASTADVADTLSGKTLSAVRAECSAEVGGHVAVRLAHGETAEQVGIPLKSVIDTEIGKLIDSGIFPISNYGTQDYLPPAVSGSFEGASSGLMNIRPMAIESDGTLVILRNGTDGTIPGTYYAYLRDAETRTELEDPVETNRRYRPAMIPSGKEVAYLVAGSEEVLVGRLYDTTTRALEGFFVAITGGTFDDTKHKGALITASQMSGMPYNAEVRVFGDTVYYIAAALPNGAGIPRVMLWTAPLSDILAGSFQGWVPVTGITSNVPLGPFTDQSYIRLSNIGTSGDISDKPFVHLINMPTTVGTNISHYTAPSTISAMGPNGIIRIRVVFASYFAVVGRAAFRSAEFSLTYDTINKTAQFDPGFEQQHTVTDTGSAIAYSGPIWHPDAGPSNAIGSPTNENRTILYTENNILFNWAVSQSVDVESLRRVRYSGVSSTFEALRCFAATLHDRKAVTNQLSYGSAVGGRLSGPIFLSNNRVIFDAWGRNSAGVRDAGLVAVTLEGGPTDHTWPSVYASSRQGWKPTIDRAFIHELRPGANLLDYSCLVSESRDGIVRAHGYNFVQFAGYSGRRRPASIDPDTLELSPDGLVVSDQVLSTIADQVILLDNTLASPTQALSQLVIPQLPDCPPLAIVVIRHGPVVHSVVASVQSVTIDVGVIVSISIGSILQKIQTHSTSTGIRWVGASDARQFGGVAIFDTGTAVLFGIPCPYYRAVTGSSSSSTIFMKWSRQTQSFGFPQAWPWLHAHTAGSTGIGATVHPLLGLGTFMPNHSLTDNMTKVIHRKLASTEEEFDTYAGSPRGDTVISGQPVAQGWVVYFGDQQPVFMVGKSFTLMPVNMDLRSIVADPSNKTFYVYVSYSQVSDSTSYTLSLTELDETMERMYIGKVITGALAISQIVIEKPYRIGIYCPSVEGRGSAIPATAGHPSEPSVLAW